MFQSLAALSLVALGVAATPLKRDTAPWCNPWGSAGFDVSYNFTLSAYNVTEEFDPNAVGSPLVLGQAGATTGAEFHVMSVRTKS